MICQRLTERSNQELRKQIQNKKWKKHMYFEWVQAGGLTRKQNSSRVE